MTRAMHLSALGAPPYRHWFFVPNGPHEETPGNHAESMVEVVEWCGDQFGPGMIVDTLKYRRRTKFAPRWTTSIRETHLLIRDDADAFVFRLRWC